MAAMVVVAAVDGVCDNQCKTEEHISDATRDSSDIASSLPQSTWMSESNVTYDDRDHTVLDYEGYWFLTGTYNASSVHETGTLSSTDVFGSNVTFVFPTPATAFFYYGIKRCCGGSYLICIDCDPNDMLWQTIDGVNRSDDGKNPPVVLYSKTFDTAGVHEVILKNQNDTRFGASQMTLDRFVITAVDDSTSANSTTSTTTSSSTYAGASLSSSSSASSSGSSVPYGAIIGGVVAGIALIVLLVLAIFCTRRRTQSDLSEPQPLERVQAMPHPLRPYTIDHTPQPSLSSTPSSQTCLTAKYGYGRLDRSRDSTLQTPAALYIPEAEMRYHPEGGLLVSSGGGIGTLRSASTRTTSSGANASPTSPRRRRRRERDAGPAPLVEEEEEVLPPEYTQVFPRRRTTRAAVSQETNTARRDMQNAMHQDIPREPSQTSLSNTDSPLSLIDVKVSDSDIHPTDPRNLPPHPDGL
ncbi:hypothetical protein FISHEDRAFT_73614 [Fistulina hepatica ATCC 64428]|uniref:Mid2 domain-containing protein n=1 Tax=Fistulina hepatica ATCC 64428 TaxID=1128425 RepID=A0A0D7AEW9_9AGAR|nr:hypothetical protein FISHEDRAFT_73614 [Fistulina hepatica ATCC 64428]